MKTQQSNQNFHLDKVMPYKLLTKVNKGQEPLSISERCMVVKLENGFLTVDSAFLNEI